MVLGINVLVNTESSLVQRKRALVLPVRRVDSREVVQRIRHIWVPVALLRLADLQLFLEKLERVETKPVLLYEAPNKAVQHPRRVFLCQLEAFSVHARNFSPVRTHESPITEQFVLFAVEHLLEHGEICEASLHALRVLECLEQPGQLVHNTPLDQRALLRAHLVGEVVDHAPQQHIPLAVVLDEISPLNCNHKLLVEKAQETRPLHEKVAPRVENWRPRRLLNAKNVNELHFAESKTSKRKTHKNVLDNVCSFHLVFCLKLREHVLKQLHRVVALEAPLDVAVKLAEVAKGNQLLKQQRHIQGIVALLGNQQGLHLTRFVG
eukprot:Opistho-2@13878